MSEADKERPLPKWAKLAWLVVVSFLILMGTTNWWLQYYRNAFLKDDIRYRLTIKVDDNGRTVEGSGIISAIYERYYSFGIPTPPGGIRIAPFYNGEAVPVDLGEKGVIFAVLGEDIKYVIPIAFEITEGFIDVERLPDLRAARGSREVPKNYRPKLATFDDLAVPGSAKAVDPDDLSRTFGPGVTLKSMTVTIVDKKTPVSKGKVDQFLPWLKTWKGLLDGDRIHRTDVINSTANSLGVGSFRTFSYKEVIQ